jgi:ubiquinone/menaquinone biosynthesis C-methylase UbiE
MLEDRKKKERELHDLLRGDAKDDSFFTSNLKFYSITRSSRNFVRNWLFHRCKGKNLLDYCCGNGKFVIDLAESGANVYGIDISPISIKNAIEEANDRGLSGRTNFFMMDAEATEFDNDYFDFIVVNGVLHHLDLKKAFPELARILKPDGEIICTEPLIYNPFFQLYRKMTPHLRSKWEIDHILSKKDIQMARHSFNYVKITKFFHLVTIGAVPFRDWPLFHPLLSILETFDSVLLRFPFIKWWAWQVVFVLSMPKK